MARGTSSLEGYMTTNRFRIAFIGACCAALALTALRPAVAENPDHVSTFKRTHNCPGCDLSKAHFGNIQAPNAKLSNANLAEADLYGANLKGADLTGAILDGANLEMANLTGATGAVLANARTDQRTTCPDETAGPCK